MITRILIGLIALLVLIGGGVAGFLFVYQPNQEAGFVDAGASAYASGAYAEAVENYHMALAVLPESARSLDQTSYRGLADAHLANGNYQAALDNYAKLADPSGSDIVAARLAAYEGMYDYPNAIATISTLIDQSDGETRIGYLRQRATLYELNLQPAEQLADLEAIYAADPAAEEMLGLELLQTYVMQGNAELVLAQSDRLIVNGTSGADPYLLRGRLRLEAGEVDAAQTDFLEGLSLGESDTLSGLLATTYLIQEDRVNALLRADEGGEDDLAQAVLASMGGDLERLNSLYLSVPAEVFPFFVYLQGLTYIEIGYPDAARSDADQLIAASPDMIWGHLLKGRALLGLDGAPQALTALADGLALAPDNPELLLQRSIAYVAEENYSSARLDVDTVLAKRPESPTGLLTLAQIEAADGQVDAALTTLDLLLEQDGAAAMTLVTRARRLKGDLLLDQAGWEEGLAELDVLVEEDPDNVALLQERALTHQALGQHAEAVEDLSTALTLSPRTVPLYGARIESYIALADFESAVQDANIVLLLERNYPTALLAQGLYDVQEENYFDAIVNLSDAIDEDDTLAIAYAARAEARFWQNEPDRAKADANQALELDDQLPQAFMARALTAAYEQEWRDAIQDADVAVDLAPEDATIIANRGLIYVEAGDYNEALDDFDRALELDSDNPDWHLLRATTLTELQRHEEAKLALEQGIELAGQGTVSGITTIELGESLLADLDRIPDAVEGLRTWTDTYHQFSITYPEEWRQFVDPGFTTPIFLQGPLDGNYRANLAIAIIDDVNLTTNQLSRAFDPPSTLPNFEQVSSGSISIGGRSGIRKVFEWTAVDDRLRETPVTVIQTYALSNGRGLIFTATIRSEDIEKYEPIFDEIFASFTLN